MTERLDRFKGYYDNKRVVEGSVKVAKEGSGEDAGNACQNLELIINNTVGRPIVNLNTPERILFTFAGGIEDRFDRKGFEEFSANPKGMIGDAVSKYGDKFTSNYLVVPPQEIGNEDHDNAARAHRIYLALSGAIGEVISSTSQGAHSGFITHTVKYIQEDAKQYLGDDDPENLSGLTAQVYASSDIKHALDIAQVSSQNAKQRVEKLLPEDGRASYTQANLEKVAEIDSRAASEALYKLIAA